MKMTEGGLDGMNEGGVAQLVGLSSLQPHLDFFLLHIHPEVLIYLSSLVHHY